MSDEQAVDGPVLVIGTGLIGTSIALALQRAQVEVLLEDANPSALQEAVYRGAGSVLGDHTPALVVVAVPPMVAGATLAQAAKRFPEATVTDTTSVKGVILDEAIARGADPQRLVGGHPMAGREVSGPAAARPDLLDDRLWVITPTGHEGQDHLARVRRLIATCGASVTEMEPAEHDAAVALVSHAPQVVASSLAATLLDAPADRITIAGQGLVDTTRIAGSDPELWAQILQANAGPVAGVLEAFLARIGQVIAGLDAGSGGDQTESNRLAKVHEVLAAGRQGRTRLPGKHGATAVRFSAVPVMVQDKPGELARLFVAAGELDVNLEDVRIEHVLGRPSGLVDLYVRPDVEEILVDGLRRAGFDVRA